MILDKKEFKRRWEHAGEKILKGGPTGRPKITGRRQKKIDKTALAYTANHGVNARSGTFSLQAVSTCPGAGDCAKDCYATQGRYKYESVWGRRFINQRALGTTKESMTRGLLRALRIWYEENHIPLECVYLLRLHDSGDFFSQKYVDSWAQALRTFTPEMDSNHRLIPYGYTKSLHLDFSSLFSVPGVRLVQSLGGKFDHLIDWRFGVSAIVPKGSTIDRPWLDANGDPEIQDLAVIDGSQDVKIALTYHGPRKARHQWKTTEELNGIARGRLSRLSNQIQTFKG